MISKKRRNKLIDVYLEYGILLNICFVIQMNEIDIRINCKVEEFLP